MKLEALEENALQRLFEDYPNLEKIDLLYNAWIRPIPKLSLQDKSYVDPELQLIYESEDGCDDPKDSNYIDRTESGRGDGFHLRPKTRVAAVERDGNGSDFRTTSRLGDGYHLRLRTQRVAAEQDGNMGASNRKAPADKRKVLSVLSAHNQQLLSEATLSRFNQGVGEAGWTGERIRHWSNEKTFPKKRRAV